MSSIFRRIFEKENRQTPRELGPGKVFVRSCLLFDDTINRGLDEAARVAEPVCSRKSLATGAIVTGFVVSTVMEQNMRNGIVRAFASLAMLALTEVYSIAKKLTDFDSLDKKNQHLDYSSQIIMLVRGFTLAMTAFDILMGFLDNVKYFADAVNTFSITLALHIVSPSNGMIERLINFIKPSGDSNIAKTRDPKRDTHE